MKKLFIVGILLAMVAVAGCEKKTTIETPAGKMTITQ
ncbi:MAG: YgdI/YgdR family lipoprotein [Candidatus Omnitrophica bacterium]|nr:YgdI/YgdR family lipoprotein [Candidatus Omnitrophota bacterium]